MLRVEGLVEHERLLGGGGTSRAMISPAVSSKDNCAQHPLHRGWFGTVSHLGFRVGFRV